MLSTSELVHDNMIFKMMPVRGRGQGVDMNIEHNIGKIKARHFPPAPDHSHLEQDLFASRGVYGSWDRLAEHFSCHRRA
jgi:hypothetical protein